MIHSWDRNKSRVHAEPSADSEPSPADSISPKLKSGRARVTKSTTPANSIGASLANERHTSALLRLAKRKTTKREGAYQALSEVIQVLQLHFSTAECSILLRTADGETFSPINPPAYLDTSCAPPNERSASEAAIARLLNELEIEKVHRHSCTYRDPQGLIKGCGVAFCNGGSGLASAIWEEGSIVGLLLIEHPDVLHTWSTEEELFFSALADHASSILVRVRLEKIAASERARLESQVRKSGRLETLAVLAGSVVHDFNNLILIIEGNAKLALTRMTAASASKTNVERIHAASVRARELSSRLLTYSGKRTITLAPVALSTLVEEIINLLETVVSEHVPIRTDLAVGLPPILADTAQLGQIVMNLITNAVDALQGNIGSITVSTRLCSADRAFLNTCMLGEKAIAGTYISLEVADTGIGMSADTLARIFDPFFTTKPFGRGLGLSGVLSAIRTHHGALKVESTPRDGTVFRVYFPVSSEKVLYT